MSFLDLLFIFLYCIFFMSLSLVVVISQVPRGPQRTWRQARQRQRPRRVASDAGDAGMSVQSATLSRLSRRRSASTCHLSLKHLIASGFDPVPVVELYYLCGVCELRFSYRSSGTSIAAPCLLSFRFNTLAPQVHHSACLSHADRRGCRSNPCRR